MRLTLGLFRETPNVVKVSGTVLRQMCSLRFSLALLLAATNLGTTSAIAGSVERGEYIFKIAGCLACHTAKDDGAAALAGRHEFKTAYGTFYSPNITPDESTGIGAWTLEEFDAALRRGKRPQGGNYYPVFPYTSYTKMHDGDVADLFTYLRSRKPVEQENREHELLAPFSWRWLNGPWKAMFFEPGSFRPRQDKSEAWNRGAYIATALAHCAECHSPRGLAGATDTGRFLAGNPIGPDGGYVPNITPHADAWIRDWDKGDIAVYLETGELPDSDYAGGAMAEVIDNGLAFLTQPDMAALVEFIATLKPLPSTRDPSSDSD